MLGGLYETLVSSDETNGAMTVMQFTVPVGMGPPPHSHDGIEVVHVLDGTLNYHLGGELIEAGPGDTVFIPAGTVETFEPTTTAKIVITYSPGGIEKFFAEAGERAPRREIPPTPTSPPDVERLTRLGAQHGLHIQAPPGG
jgi:quercetin dioxygenase-like cupin family protein